MKNKYIVQKERDAQALKNLESLSHKYSLIRLIVFILAVVFAVLAYLYTSWFYTCTILSLIGFVYILKKHDAVKDKIAYLQTHLGVLQHYLDRFDNTWKSYPENGSEYVDEVHVFTKDLDVFGKASLFQYINVAATSLGRDIVADLLVNGLANDKIVERQGAVAELCDDFEFYTELEALLILASQKQDSKKVIENFKQLDDNLVGNGKVMEVLKWILPVSTTIILILSALFGGVILSLLLRCVIVLQLILTLLFATKNKQALQPVFELQESLEAYLNVFRLVETKQFKSSELIALQTGLRQPSSVVSIKQLTTISSMVKTRLNIIAYLAFSSLLMWDFHCIYALGKWQRAHSKQMAASLIVITKLEAISTLATLARVKQQTCYPNVVDKVYLNARQIAHPLIHEPVSIANDFESFGSSCVITGSNMSGKTTFLRTLGLNTILAYAGAPVLAQHFELGRMKIYTSMRIEDNVSEGISTFYAEILRIKTILDDNRQHLPMLVLIDEIFKGTNSKDRIMGAYATIKQLSDGNTISLVTTHDFELSELANDELIKSKNYHFSEYYSDNTIHFDYKIKTGVATTTNAQYLLKMVGIME